MSSVGPSRIEMANGNSIARPAHGLRIISPVVACSFRGQTIVIDSCKFQQSSHPLRPLSFPFPHPPLPPRPCIHRPFADSVAPYIESSIVRSEIRFCTARASSVFRSYTCGRSANPLTPLLSQKRAPRTIAGGARVRVHAREVISVMIKRRRAFSSFPARNLTFLTLLERLSIQMKGKR